jgi:Bifunctional DNA primase/polymerase, N-terminal
MYIPRLPGDQVPRPDSTAEQAGYRPLSHLATRDEVLAAAVEYARCGWPVFWCEQGGKRPAPVAVHGFKSAHADAERLAAGMPRGLPNLAIPTGYPGPADVLDVDEHGEAGNGWAAFGRLKNAGLVAGAFRLVRTPSGGLHAYFAPTNQRSGGIRDAHIDFKASGGYVLVPPSQIGGRRYEVIADRPQTGARLDWPAVQQVLRPPRQITSQRRNGSGKVDHLPDWVASQTAVGDRNRALYWAACRAAEAGNEPVLIELVDAGVSAGLDRHEALKTVVSAARRIQSGR